MNRQTAPDDEELARLIHAAFEALPGPDEDRLASVGERLVQQAGTQKKRSRNRRHSWYWLWLLLAGGTVTAAAWWASDYVTDDLPGTQVKRQQQTQPIQQPTNRAEPRPADGVEGQDDKPPQSGRQSPIIYKREGY